MAEIQEPTGAEKLELACVYATLILNDAEKDVDAASMKSIIEAAGVDVPDFWINTFAKAFAGRDLTETLENASKAGGGGGGGGGAASGGDGGDGDEDEDEEEEEEEEEESDDDFGFDIFG